MNRVTIMLLEFQNQKDVTCWEMRYTTGGFQSLSVQHGGPVQQATEASDPYISRSFEGGFSLKLHGESSN
jgi:hypothetical protein